MQLTEQQQQFFDTFGFLVFPGLLADRVHSIIEDFETLFRTHGGGHNGTTHDGTARSCLVPFIDQSANLSALLEDPRISGIARGLLGDDFNYVGSDGNYYVGDTSWHSDGFHPVGKFIKIALYLDPVARDTGALRVIPGSHRIDLVDKWQARQAIQAPSLWNIEQRDVPAVALESTPGDVVAFNHNLMHAAFGGNNRRRMFTFNLCRRCKTPEEIQDLENFVAGAARFWLDEFFGKEMLATATAERMKHLEQAIEHSKHLPALAAKARETMSEPSRG